MKIKLGRKTYKSPEKISVRTFAKAIDYSGRIDTGQFLGEGYPVSELEEISEFVVEYFGNAFTIDEFMDGFQVSDGMEFAEMLFEIFQTIQFDAEKRLPEKK